MKPAACVDGWQLFSLLIFTAKWSCSEFGSQLIIIVPIISVVPNTVEYLKVNVNRSQGNKLYSVKTQMADSKCQRRWKCIEASLSGREIALTVAYQVSLCQFHVIKRIRERNFISIFSSNTLRETDCFTFLTKHCKSIIRITFGLIVIRTAHGGKHICIWWMQRLQPKVEQPNKSEIQNGNEFDVFWCATRRERTHWSCVTPFQMAGANDLAGFMLQPVNGPWTKWNAWLNVSKLWQHSAHWILTVTAASPATANPNLSDVQSCRCAFLGSQTPQQNQMSADVAKNSTANACHSWMCAFGRVTHNPTPPSDFIISAGTIILSRP